MNENILAIVRQHLAHARTAEAERDWSAANFHQWLATQWLALAIGAE